MKDIDDLEWKMTLAMAALCDPGPGGPRKGRFPSFLASTVLSLPMTAPPLSKARSNSSHFHIILDDIEMLRDNFKKKLAEKPKASGGFRSVVGTGVWQKLKETAAM